MLFNNRSVVKELFMLNDKRHTFDAISSLDMMALMNIYYTDYEVFINFQSGQTTSIRPTSYVVDTQNSTSIANNANLNPYVISTGINNQILINHRDSSNVLVVGHDIKEYIKLYYQNTSIPVDPQYYQVITTKVNSSGNFQSTIILDQRLRSGTYLIEYKYYASDSTKTFQITKAASTAGNILQLHQNYLDPINNPTNNFTTEVPLLYPITASDLIISQHTIDGLPAYLDNSYYSIGLLENIVIAPFATLTNVTMTTQYLSSGFVRYVITYQITSESGNIVNYVNTINEVPVTLDYRYINGVVTYDTNLEAKREDDLTTFEFAYSVNPLFSHLFYNLDTGLDAYLEVTSPGYPTYNYQTNDNLLTILMDSAVDPGSYVFTISLKRKTGVGQTTISLPLGTQTITKLGGSSSYLTNIAFGEEGTELSYPSIEILNNDTNTPILYDENNENPKFSDINNSYDSFVYYVGIEYDGADINNKEKHIRIIGEIDNINLNEYAPRLVEFLPIGATIQRLVYTEGGQSYTTPVNRDSDPSDIALLETDYTLYPTDGSEPDEDSVQDVIITYLVTSEDQQNKTYYYISVVDATYNINYIFNIFYVGEDNIRRSIHDIDTFNNLPIRIQTAIMNTGESFFEVKSSVDQFPSFTNISKFESHISMYYQALNGLENDATKYRFRLARNRAGFYQFSVDLPSEYVYTMFFNNQELNDISNYVSGVEGKYFYINTGIRNRTRTIEIVIKDATGLSGWGLHENGASYYGK